MSAQPLSLRLERRQESELQLALVKLSWQEALALQVVSAPRLRLARLQLLGLALRPVLGQPAQLALLRHLGLEPQPELVQPVRLDLL